MDDDDATLCTSNCTNDDSATTDTTLTSRAASPIQTQQQETLFHASHINIAVDHAIADAGATGHFVLPGTPVTDIAPAVTPLVINLPDGEKIESTHTCRLNLPWLPDKARMAHIIPG